MAFGYIGLGSMGGAIAQRMLLQHEIVVFDLNADSVTSFVKDGAVAASSVADLASKCDVIFLCLPSSNEVRAVIEGPDGVAANMSGGVICDMTTGDPMVTRELAEAMPKGITLIDGPVSGGPAGARNGTLAIMVGGSDNAIGHALPALEAVSPNIFRPGGVGSGHVMKLANNMLNAGSRLLAFEALALAVKNGIDPDVCTEILNKSSGRNFTTDVTLPKFVLQGNMNQGFSLGLMNKDIRLANQLGMATGVPLPVANAAREVYHAALNEHGPNADVNEVIRLVERGSVVKLVPEKK
jgi:3-hydroxyisobutyrate dehydrogenase